MYDLTLGSEFEIGGTLHKVTYASSKRIVIDIIQPKRVPKSKPIKPSRYMRPSVVGVGFIGVGPHKIRDEDGRQTKMYKTWYNLIHRVYGPKADEGLTVCAEWHCFQSFGDWYVVHAVDEHQWTLCRYVPDLTNTHYSPDTVVHVPREIAMNRIQAARYAGTDNTASRVRFHKKLNRYMAVVAQGADAIIIGNYVTEAEAVTAVQVYVKKRLLEVLEANRDAMTAKNYATVKAWYI